MAAKAETSGRRRGSITTLASGSLFVRVYAGIDPVTGKRHYLTETVPAGPKAAAAAGKERTKVLADVDAERHPRTSATLATLLERYPENLEVEASTRADYEGIIANHIVPLLGESPISRVRGEAIDSFYRELRTCRKHCHGAQDLVDHRTRREHRCDGRCRPHQCTPLGKAMIRKAHVVLSSAFDLAVRWEWLGKNPVVQASTPNATKPRPHPPSSAQAARIASQAWMDAVWGMFVWLAMTTGARRGELCAIRWNRIDFSSGVLSIWTSIAEVHGRTWEKDTKDHQQRRIVLDPQTLGCSARSSSTVPTKPPPSVSSSRKTPTSSRPTPDASGWPRPTTTTDRYSRMCRKLGYSTHLHELRHYSATELIAAGVDVRTVAGRLGHGGGGTTTLRVYSAWVAEADQRASRSLAARMPELPGGFPGGEAPVIELPVPEAAPKVDEDSPYRRIAADVRGAIRMGVLGPGDSIPTLKTLAERYGVSIGTAQRAVTVLADAGEVVVVSGQRTHVT